MAGGTNIVEQMMQHIETHVLEEVWLGRSRAGVGSVLVVMLCTSAAVWRIDASGHVPTVAAVMLLLGMRVGHNLLAHRIASPSRRTHM